MTNFWILDGHEPVRVDNIHDWSDHVRMTEVARDFIAGVVIVTQFHGANHAPEEEPPHIFATRVFGGEHAGYMACSSTWEEAEAEHTITIAMVMGMTLH